MRGAWIGLEHPADRGREPYPSFFNTAVVKTFLSFFSLKYQLVDQCRFGADSVKPTGLLLPIKGNEFLSRRCNHRKHRKPLVGFDAVTGLFNTHAAARYPPSFHMR